MSYAKLPSLNGLRALEAVARNRSFRRAADELFVTPAAVTHQIKQVESFFSFPLLERRSAGIELTPAMQLALPRLQEGFDALNAAVALLNGHRQVPQLTVGASATFASRWLLPRLHRFIALHPGIDVRLAANSRSASPDLEPDIDIRLSTSTLHGEHVARLFGIELVPMCHPRLLTGSPPLLTPADLQHQTLLHGDAQDPKRAGVTWERWLQHAGLEGIDARRGVYLDHSTLALDAAAEGLGVTLATPLLASAELLAGNVVIAFDLALSLSKAYYVVTSEAAMARPEVAAFHAWLLREANGAGGAGASG